MKSDGIRIAQFIWGLFSTIFGFVVLVLSTLMTARVYTHKTLNTDETALLMMVSYLVIGVGILIMNAAIRE
tara:strand:- start:102 stop:314 length:213 start_codon:yes stop_codon:yes gene_type:complete